MMIATQIKTRFLVSHLIRHVSFFLCNTHQNRRTTISLDRHLSIDGLSENNHFLSSGDWKLDILGQQRAIFIMLPKVEGRPSPIPNHLQWSDPRKSASCQLSSVALSLTSTLNTNLLMTLWKYINSRSNTFRNKNFLKQLSLFTWGQSVAKS